MKLERFLLVNPPYEAVGVNESVSSVSVTLALAMLAGLCRRHGREVRILDLNLSARWEEAYEAEVHAFVSAVAEGRPPLPDGEAGLKALVLAEAAVRSNAERRTVEVAEI